MAHLNKYQEQKYVRRNGEWVIDHRRKPRIKYSIFWSNGEPWLEALFYLSNKQGKPSTIRCNAIDLKAYADWLEKNQIHWLHFPIREDERCLYRYRGHLIDTLTGASAVRSRRMSAIVRFYKWAKSRGYIEKQTKMWADRKVPVTFFDEQGFQRTSSVWTTDLRITYRKSQITSIEGGLVPISPEDRDLLLAYLQKQQNAQSTILHAMFVIGFFSGARIGSIRSMRIENLESAIPDSTDPEIMLVAAGPGTGIDTKFDVSGYIRFLKPVYKYILDYAKYNIARLERQAKAAPAHKSLLFLTKSGQPYSEGSMNTAMSNLRKSLVRDGLTQFHDLKFHQSRATCGTELAREYMKKSDLDAIDNVREWLMHKDEKTTWSYIKFLKNKEAAKKANAAFTEQFLGPRFNQSREE